MSIKLIKSQVVKRPNDGFTLIELLVVVAIITVMSGTAMALYLSAEGRARDGQRQADLKSVQAALEQYHNDLNTYPPSTGANSLPWDNTNAFDIGGSIKGNNNIYLTALPKDPLFVGDNTWLNYRYLPQPDGCDGQSVICTNYCLFAQVENTSSVTSDQSCINFIQNNQPKYSLFLNYNYEISRSSSY